MMEKRAIQQAVYMIEWWWNYRYSEKEKTGNVYFNHHSDSR